MNFQKMSIKEFSLSMLVASGLITVGIILRLYIIYLWTKEKSKGVLSWQKK